MKNIITRIVRETRESYPDFCSGPAAHEITEIDLKYSISLKLYRAVWLCTFFNVRLVVRDQMVADFRFRL
jgi:hypothetical protein